MSYGILQKRKKKTAHRNSLPKKSVFSYNKNDVGLFGRFLGKVYGVGETDGVFQIVAVRFDLIAAELVRKSPVKRTGVVVLILAGRPI